MPRGAVLRHGELLAQKHLSRHPFDRSFTISDADESRDLQSCTVLAHGTEKFDPLRRDVRHIFVEAFRSVNPNRLITVLTAPPIDLRSRAAGTRIAHRLGRDPAVSAVAARTHPRYDQKALHLLPLLAFFRHRLGVYLYLCLPVRQDYLTLGGVKYG